MRIESLNADTRWRQPPLLCAFAAVRQQHPDALLWIVGSGPRENALRVLASKLGLSYRRGRRAGCP